jgi:hypothetical protein
MDFIQGTALILLRDILQVEAKAQMPIGGLEEWLNICLARP